jgi:ATP/ADP translocase/CRP-like cAMP-binding protein
MDQSLSQRLLKPFAEVRAGEATTALMMFVYAFLAMTSYNIIQPLTRSKLIASLGAVNVPYVYLGLGVASGIVMAGYTRLYSALPRRWALPGTQVVMALLLFGFWALFRTEQEWVSVAFYIWGAIFSVLLTSQFWTLANAVYDPRQAKRLFGFIGGGIMIGGLTGAGITKFLIKRLGSNTLLLWSGTAMVLCLILVSVILGREKASLAAGVDPGAKEEKGVTLKRAFELLRGSQQVQLISVIIAFGSIGAALIEQQLNMAAESLGQEDTIGEFLASVRFYLGIVATVLQVWVTPRIHRYLGVGFALMMLPGSLALTAAGILATASLWAPAAARISDQSIRYTVDKTTREVLFLPLPATLRQEVKPFVDVTVDRMARGIGAIGMLVLIQPWGLELQWYQLSLVSLAFAFVWFFMGVRAKREYLKTFRQSIERQDVRAAEVRLDVADLSTVETLIEELASPDPRRVIYAIDLLESLAKRNLITPLLLYHESADVRARALQAVGDVPPEVAARWRPSVQRMLADESPEVRAAAVSVLANIGHEQASDLIRPYLADRDPRIASTAAVVLGRSDREADVQEAEQVLTRLAGDSREAAAAGRREVAQATRQIQDPRFRPLLIPLLYDPDPAVAAEAMRSVREIGGTDFIFVPTLVSLLRNRALKSSARDVLVAYGEPVLDALNHFLRDPDEDIWVRRHLPATMARIPCQKSVDLLVAALGDPDGFLRYKVVAALEKLRRDHDTLTIPRDPVEALLTKESGRWFNYLTLRYNLFVTAGLPSDTVLAQALGDKMGRTHDRIYRLLGLIYPWRDVASARWALEHGAPRARANAAEVLDNMLSAALRKRLMPLIEEMPEAERVRKANVILKTRPRDVEDTLLQLINDDDEVVSAAAIDLVEQQKVWALVDDIEHVLAHRDVKDWAVFESASWALAAHRMPESRRRALWVEPLPASQLAARLRKMPLFESVTIDELFRIAGAGRQVRHEPARVLYQEGAVPDQVQFLLDGRVSTKPRGGVPQEVGPPAHFGLEEALEASAMNDTVRTVDASVCLVLESDQLRTLLADNTDLVQGLCRVLVAQSRAEDLVIPGTAPAEPAGGWGPALKPIEKVLVLEAVPVFSGLGHDEMLSLVSIAHDVALVEGQPLFAEADAAAIYAVLTGRVSLEGADGGSALQAGPGSLIGVYETLAGSPVARRARVLAAGRALKIDRDDLFDLLGQRPALLQQLFAALVRSRVAAVAG